MKERLRLEQLVLPLRSWLGLAVLLALFGVSFWFSQVTQQAPRQQNSATRVVRVLHWQLEDGFRESLQGIMDAYNQQAHVLAAGYQVEQLAIPQSYYGPFSSVHLLGDTAPDLVQIGHSRLLTRYGPNFLISLDEYLKKPNPYPLHGVRETSWLDSFEGRLERGAHLLTGQRFSVPLALGGTVRFFYNADLLQQAHAVLQQAMGQSPRPGWLQILLADEPDLATFAITPDVPPLRAWVGSGEPPRSFGQLVLLCEAILARNRMQGGDLIAITAHKDIPEVLGRFYNSAFIYPFARTLDYNVDGRLPVHEIHAAFLAENLSFRNQRVQATFALWRRLALYFPNGFTGMDREQAMRRFVMGKALFHPAGSWDAKALLEGGQVRGAAMPFEVGVMNPVLPTDGERWAGLRPRLPSESTLEGGLFFGVPRNSSNAAEAVDFLRYLSNPEANERLLRGAGWLPIVKGVAASEMMAPFVPVADGFHPYTGLGFISRSQDPALRALFLSYISGQIAYPTFSRDYLAILNNPRLGLQREWFRVRRADREVLRQIDHSLEVQRFLDLMDPVAPLRAAMHGRLLRESSQRMGGRQLALEWTLSGQHGAFPEF